MRRLASIFARCTQSGRSNAIGGRRTIGRCRAIARSIAVVLAVGFAVGVAAPVSAEPPRTHEILTEKPSGFWTSNRPAVGGAYRWRLLGIGVVLVAATGYGMLRLIRRANAERANRR